MQFRNNDASSGRCHRNGADSNSPPACGRIWTVLLNTIWGNKSMYRGILCAAPLAFIAAALTLAGCDVDDSYACRNSSGDDAIAACSRVIARNPIDAVAYNNRGFSYAQQKGDYDRAIADYDQAIKLDPNFAHAYNNRGSAYADKGDHDRAIADYDQAIKFDPNFAQAYYNRGRVYHDKGDYDRAIADYDEAIELDPNF